MTNIIVKEYSGNEGMLKTLVNAGIVSKPIRYTQSGYISAPICKFLKK